jgi:hypothetical protein
MEERRVTQRRKYIPTTQFPLHAWNGELVASERRFLPTRRVNDIEVKELSYQDFIAELH